MLVDKIIYIDYVKKSLNIPYVSSVKLFHLFYLGEIGENKNKRLLLVLHPIFDL